MLLDVTHRVLLPELMDDPALDPAQHIRALRGLERINRVSRSARLLWGPIRSLAREAATPVRVLDIATGGGDVPMRLWAFSRREGLPVRVDGCDRSPTAVKHARRAAARLGAEVRFFQCDALAHALPDGYDILVSSLFLHHLSVEQSIVLLRAMAQAAGRMVLVNDLVRDPAGLALAYAGTRLLTTSEIVHADGPQSVRAAYTVEEVVALSQQAGLDDSRLVRRWPCRFLLIWRRR